MYPEVSRLWLKMTEDDEHLAGEPSSSSMSYEDIAEYNITLKDVHPRICYFEMVSTSQKRPPLP